MKKETLSSKAIHQDKYFEDSFIFVKDVKETIRRIKDGVRDTFLRNAEMIRDDINGDKWIISKKDFNKALEVIDKEVGGDLR